MRACVWATVRALTVLPMDAERRCSPPSRPAAAGEASREEAAAAAADRMVKIEMEAAEALAGLAHFASRRGDGGAGGKWGNGARRMTKRARSESPPPPRTTSRSASKPGPAAAAAAARPADPPEVRVSRDLGSIRGFQLSVTVSHYSVLFD